MTEESLTPGNKSGGAHVATKQHHDPAKIWFFCLLPVLVVAVGALVYILTNDVSIAIN